MNDTSVSRDEAFLRRAIEVARRARRGGSHPFGAILVDDAGAVLLEVENGFLPHRDMTAHAERLLATEASRRFGAQRLRACTVYTSTEPCAMCSGAMYWAGWAASSMDCRRARSRRSPATIPRTPPSTSRAGWSSPPGSAPSR